VRDASAELTAADQDTGDWAVRQAVHTAWQASVPLVLVVGGAWALWTYLFWWLRIRRFTLAPGESVGEDEPAGGG
jgi:hypothetical protein